MLDEITEQASEFRSLDHIRIGSMETRLHYYIKILRCQRTNILQQKVKLVW